MQAREQKSEIKKRKYEELTVDTDMTLPNGELIDIDLSNIENKNLVSTPLYEESGSPMSPLDPLDKSMQALLEKISLTLIEKEDIQTLNVTLDAPIIKIVKTAPSDKRETHAIRKLDLSENEFISLPETLGAMTQFIKQHQPSHLILRSIKFHLMDSTKTEWISSIAASSSLIRLDLSSSLFTAEQLALLLSALKEKSTLEHLNISDIHCINDHLSWMPDFIALIRKTPLLSLELSHLYFTSTISIHISTALQEKNTLLSLDLSNNQLTNDGVANLVNNLKKNTSLTSLTLNHLDRNSLTFGSDLAVTAYAKYLTQNTSLTSLSYRGNNINQSLSSYQVIFTALQTNNSLTSLNLSHKHEFKIEDTTALTTLLKKDTLSELRLQNTMNETSLLILLNALATNTSLYKLSISHNKTETILTDQNLLDLALKTNRFLCELTIGMNGYTHKNNTQLAQNTASRRNWLRLSVVTSFARANRNHTFIDSILPILDKNILPLTDSPHLESKTKPK